MTISIDRAARERASMPPAAEPKPSAGPRGLIIGLRIFVAVATAAGIALGVADLASDGHTHLVLPCVGSFILAGLAVNNLVHHYLLADRQEFYRRGQLDGWVKCYRGQAPDSDDPLVR
jgi:hypothetical protein